MKIQLSDHFTYKRLIRFVFPSIIMMICTSMYSIIDGLFISNFAGKTAFAAVNLILPVAMGVGAIGFMIGSGGSAIVAKTLGEGKKKKQMNIFYADFYCFDRSYDPVYLWIYFYKADLYGTWCAWTVA